jgi:predicted TIM-barrel fold metal-dependent hydrolase
MREVFDVHHHVGRAFDALGGALPSAEEQARFDQVELADRLRIMDEGGVRQSMVIPGHGYLRPHGIADTRAVNDGIAAYRDATPDRFPVACGIVEPSHGTYSFDEIDRCANELGLVALSFHTRFQGVSLDSQWIHRYLDRMAEAGLVPVIHAMDDTPEEALWKLTTLARARPDQQLLALDAFGGFEATRHCFHVADLCPNIVWDTSLSYNFDFICDFARQFGVDRVVFGTDLYSHPVGQRISHILQQIEASALTDEEKDAVVGGNARRLLRVP